VAAYRDASDLGLLLGACDELILAGDARALEVWSLTGRKAPLGIFNGDFDSLPLNHGFDWRVAEAPGVTQVNNRIVLSGRQAESVSLLRQVLHFGAGRLHWEARMQGIKSPSGIEWRVAGQHAPLSPSEDWAAGEMTINARDRFPLLELVYQRPVGESRAEGNVELRHIRLVAP
jgi:hypothetical protein